MREKGPFEAKNEKKAKGLKGKREKDGLLGGDWYRVDLSSFVKKRPPPFFFFKKCFFHTKIINFNKNVRNCSRNHHLIHPHHHQKKKKKK